MYVSAARTNSIETRFLIAAPHLAQLCVYACKTSRVSSPAQCPSTESER